MKHADRCSAAGESNTRGKRAARSRRPGNRARRAGGFTLIELMIAIAILAVVAVLSWRGLDQIVRGRERVANVMASERVLAMTFDQIGADARAAALDDDTEGGTSILVGPGSLQIVRYLELPQRAPRLQVVRYAVVDRQLIRSASPPLENMAAVRAAINGGNRGGGWTQVALIHGIDGMQSFGWLDQKGWTSNNGDLRQAAASAIAALSNAMTNGAPVLRTVRGLQVRLALSGGGQEFVRAYPVGE